MVKKNGISGMECRQMPPANAFICIEGIMSLIRTTDVWLTAVVTQINPALPTNEMNPKALLVFMENAPALQRYLTHRWLGKNGQNLPD
jgi:hypothetical protein